MLVPVVIENLYSNLEIIDATKRNWQHQLFTSIGPSENHTLGPLRKILQIAKNLGTCTIIVEPSYIDSDFLDEYQQYYCKRFGDMASKCARIHFFKSCFTKREFPSLNLQEQGYLGFSVVRPTSSFRTARTVLVSPNDDGDTQFTLCKEDFKANLCGNRLLVKGMPFMQQDTNVCVCAQAALWMSCLYLHQKYQVPRLKPSEISRIATEALTVGPIRKGLIPEQVLAALRKTGLEPLIFTHYDTELTARIIYAYVESELPVILLVKLGGEGHAIVIIGHDFVAKRRVIRSWDSNIYWIDRFYIQDDASGPYGELLLRGKSRQVYTISQNAAYIIVPVPQNVSLQADDVFDHVAVLKDHLNDFVDLFEDSESFRFSASELSGLVFRTFLRSSNEFKTNLPRGMSDVFRHSYRSLPMPRYIWVTEISKARYINKTHSKDRKILGEIIMDSTADRHSAMKSYLAIHLLGRMFVRKPLEEDPYVLYVDPSERPYAHLVR